MVAVVIGGFLIAAGVMADQHRWLWAAIAVWAASLSANNWLRDAYDGTAAALYGTALIVGLVLGPMLLGWVVARVVRRARHDGPEWDSPPAR